MKYMGYMPNDFLDGLGVCVSFWVSGCPFHCVGCHNPEAWDFVWTGYTIEELKEQEKQDERISSILKLTDTLIEGRFMLAERDITLPLRGSRNQRVLQLGIDY